jgi:hypothetical protein
MVVEGLRAKVSRGAKRRGEDRSEHFGDERSEKATQARTRSVFPSPPKGGRENRRRRR